jgi:hypothetical protein
MSALVYRPNGRCTRQYRVLSDVSPKEGNRGFPRRHSLTRRAIRGIEWSQGGRTYCLESGNMECRHSADVVQLREWRLGRRRQLGPVVGPVVPEFLAGNGPSAFPLDVDSEVGRTRLNAVHDVSQVADGGLATPCKCLPRGLVGQRLQVGLEIHAQITPDGVVRCQHHSVSDVGSTPGMAEDALIRRENFRRLMAERGWEVRGLADSLGWGRYSFWRDLISDDQAKSFGEKLARKIEDKAGLPRGWLDAPGQKTPAKPALVRSTPETPPGAEFTEEDFAILADVKLAMLPEELVVVRKRAAHFREMAAAKETNYTNTAADRLNTEVRASRTKRPAQRGRK